MSHNVRIVTKLQDKDVLSRSLTELGVQCFKNENQFSFFMPQALAAIGADDVRVPNFAINASFVKTNDFYTLSYDAYAEKAAERVLDTVSQRYAYNVVKDEINNDLSARGFSVEEEEHQKSGAIKITVSRWV